eukprot:TRINITY_DN5453_c0_g2_i1.p1 TRINITY_DN5453_c0_g2~~TRINITY_DN5453_c0_g2_i1.p1  ORF type:complete len:307 (-),score=60.37 TRINITY_DN5453_c0_g2_i1:72-935(-)
MPTISLTFILLLLLPLAIFSSRPADKLFTQNLKTKPNSFERIFIIQFENQPYIFVEWNSDFIRWAKLGVFLTNYYAITHPSQPNYWCQVAGDFFDYHEDSLVNLNHTNLVDLLEAKGITWKAYEEDYPGNCFAGEVEGKYYRKHNPFISFDSVRNSPQRCAKIVNASELDDDLAKGTLPQYSYYTPNIDNDGHDTGLDYAGRFLTSFMSQRLDKFPNGTLIVITWDEDDYLDFNHIYTAVLGSMVVPGTKDDTPYTHYSLLRTVEDNFGLGSLGRNDAQANGFQCFP